MKRLVAALAILWSLSAIPMEAAAGEITLMEEQELLHSGGYTTLVTAGITGVGASAGLLILSNRKNR